MSLPAVIPKLHFVFGLAMFLFVAMMVVEEDLSRRALLLLPIVILDIISKILFSMDQIGRLDGVLDVYKNNMETQKEKLGLQTSSLCSIPALFLRNLRRGMVISV